MTGATVEASPLDQLHISADLVWSKVCPGYVLTDDDVRAIVRAERMKREQHIKKTTDKKVKREEKQAEAEA